MRSLRAPVLATALLPLAAACSSDEALPLPACPADTTLVAGQCLPTCTDASTCLRGEACVEGVCTPQTYDRPTILEFEAWPRVITDSPEVDLRYLVKGADKVEILRSSGDGPEVLVTTDSDSPEFGRATIGRITETTTLHLVASLQDQYFDNDEIIITVGATTDAPVIDVFTADREVVAAGDTVTLSWSTRNADLVTVLADNEPLLQTEAAMDSTTVVVEASTQFTLRAEAGDQQVTKEVFVEVSVNPGVFVEAGFYPQQILVGDNAVLEWSTAGAENVIVSDSSGAIFSTTQPPLVAAGRYLASPPPGRAAYIVRAGATGVAPGSATAVLDVAARPAPPRLEQVEVNPRILPPGEQLIQVELSWVAIPDTAQVEVLMPDGVIQTFTGSGRLTTRVSRTESSRFDVRALVVDGGATRARVWALAQDEEFEPNDTRGSADEITNYARSGVLGRVVNLDLDWYRVEAFAGARLLARVQEAMCPAGMRLELHTENSQAPIDGAQTSANGDCPVLEVPNLDEESYYLRLSKPSGTGDIEYVLSAELFPPVCGNGQREAGEQCDDGNQAFGDFCAPDCTLAPSHIYQISQGSAGFAQPGQSLEEAVFTNYIPNYTPTDEGIAIFELPFGFRFFGRTYNGVAAFTNGFLSFLPADGTNFSPVEFFGPSYPNAIIAPFVANLDVASGHVKSWVDEGSDSEGKRFVVEFENLKFVENTESRVSAQVWLYENGRISVVYGDLSVAADDVFYGFLEGPQGIVQYGFPSCVEAGCDASRLSNREVVIQNLAASPGG